MKKNAKEKIMRARKLIFIIASFFILAIGFNSSLIAEGNSSDSIELETKPQEIQPQIPQMPSMKQFGFGGDSFFDDMQKEMNEMMKSFGGRGMPKGFGKFPGGQVFSSVQTQAHDISLSGDNLIITIDLPGHSKDRIDLRLKGNMLTISSERKSQNSQQNKNKSFYKQEISYGHFSRSISLPRKVIKEKTHATYKNGVLTVVAPIDKSSPENEKGYPIPIH
jgi:HSP20 family protein